MSVTRRARLVVALATAALLSPSAALADPPDSIAEARAAETTTATRIAELERQLAQLSATRDQADVAAGRATEAYLQAAVLLEEAQAETQAASDAAEAAAADVEEARSSLGAIAQLLYQGGSASLASVTPFLTTDNLEAALDSTTYMEQLGTRTDGELERFEALKAVAAILEGRAERAAAAEEAATAALAEAAEDAQANADAAAFQVEYSAEQRDALIAQLAAERQTTVELEQARQDTLEEQRIERQNLAGIREAQTVAAVDSLAAEPTAASREPAVSPGVDPEPSTTQPTSSASRTPTPAPATARPTTPAPTRTTPAPAPSRTTPAPAPSRTTPAPAPSRTTPAPAPSRTTPAPAPATPARPSSSTPAPLGAAQVALNYARAQVGKPYIWGATGPNGYDCSGLTSAAYSAAGIYIGRTTRAQYSNTARVKLADMQPGDLIFYSSNGRSSGIYHVAIYTGNGMRLHAPSPGRRVEHVRMYYGNILPYGGRVTG